MDTDRSPHFRSGAVRLEVGDEFPEIWADSTVGHLRVRDFARGGYTLILFHPGAYVQASEAELVEFARAAKTEGWQDTRILGLSQSDVLTERMWLDEVARRRGVTVDFPVICDEAGQIAAACGLQCEAQRTLRPVRRSVVIGPTFKVCAIWDYPPEIARSPVEVLRVISLLRARTAVTA